MRVSLRTKGNGDTQCSVQDVSGTNMPYGESDGYAGLACQFVDGDRFMETGEGYAPVTGSLLDGTQIVGTDSINLVSE